MTQELKVKPNLSNYDDVYQLIIDMHKELSEEESHSANAKLILTLANHIGDASIISEATRIVRENTLQWRSAGDA